jgi:hypothetical protein
MLSRIRDENFWDPDPVSGMKNLGIRDKTSWICYTVSNYYVWSPWCAHDILCFFFSCVSDPQVAKDLVFGNCGVLQEINTTKVPV